MSQGLAKCVALAQIGGTRDAPARYRPRTQRRKKTHRQVPDRRAQPPTGVPGDLLQSDQRCDGVSCHQASPHTVNNQLPALLARPQAAAHMSERNNVAWLRSPATPRSGPKGRSTWRPPRPPRRGVGTAEAEDFARAARVSAWKTGTTAALWRDRISCVPPRASHASESRHA